MQFRVPVTFVVARYECDFIQKKRGHNIIYIGLTDEEEVGLAIQHQLDQNRTHSLTFMDRAR